MHLLVDELAAHPVPGDEIADRLRTGQRLNGQVLAVTPGQPRCCANPASPCDLALIHAHFVKSMIACALEQQGIASVLENPPKGSKVKSSPAEASNAVDRHERARDYLSPGEVAKFLVAAKAGRHSVRDYLLLLMTHRRGLRVSEAVGLRRDELDLNHALPWVRRLKGGLFVEQPIVGDELRANKRHPATRTDTLPWLFISERGQPLTRQAVSYLVAAAAERAGLRGFIRTRSGIHKGSSWPTRAMTCPSPRTTSATVTLGTPSTIPAQRDGILRGSGADRK